MGNWWAGVSSTAGTRLARSSSTRSPARRPRPAGCRCPSSAVAAGRPVTRILHRDPRDAGAARSTLASSASACATPATTTTSAGSTVIPRLRASQPGDRPPETECPRGSGYPKRIGGQRGQHRPFRAQPAGPGEGGQVGGAGGEVDPRRRRRASASNIELSSGAANSAPPSTRRVDARGAPGERSASIRSPPTPTGGPAMTTVPRRPRPARWPSSVSRW